MNENKLDENKDTNFDNIKSIISKDKEGFIKHLHDSFNTFKKEKNQDKNYIYKLFHTFILNAVQTFKNNLEEFKEVIDEEGDNFLFMEYPVEVENWNKISIRAPRGPLKEKDLSSEEAISKNASTRAFRYFELKVINLLNNNIGMLVDKGKWIPIQFNDDLDRYGNLTKKEYKEILNGCWQNRRYGVDIKGNIKTGKKTYKKYEGALFVNFLPFIIDIDNKIAFQLVAVGIVVKSGYKLKNWALKDLEKQTNRVINKLKAIALDDSYGFKFKLPENLLEKKSIKTLIPKFKKIYTHSEIGNLIHKIFKTQKLNDKGTGIIEEDFIKGEVKIWESKGVEYIVKVDDLLKFEGRPPKVYVSQIKNLSLLMGMIQEQQYNNFTKEAKCEFNLSYYAERRGYSKEEIQQGGYFKELKRDLLTGAYTTYRIDNIIIEGKKYIRHGIPNFYILDEPKDHENKWIVTLNNPYSDWITKILNGEAGQYSITDHKAIEDRHTTERPYLFLFYMQLTKRKRANLITMPVKIGSLLKDMKIDEQILARPKECFELLKECLIYFNEHYQPTPEIEQFFLYNDFHKTETVKLPLHISEAFKQYGYEDFKGLIKAIGIKDIREAYISFKRPYSKPKSKFIKFILTEDHKKLIKEILEWAEDWEGYKEGNEIPFTEEERYKFLADCIRFMGYEKLEDSFLQEKTREHPDVFNEPYHVDDPMGYFTKRLPELLKEDKEAKASSKSFQ